VLNLFLALLLSSFGAESLKHSQEDSEPNKLQEAVDRINRFIVYLKSKLIGCLERKNEQNGGLYKNATSAAINSIGSKVKPGSLVSKRAIPNGHARTRQLRPKANELALVCANGQ